MYTAESLPGCCADDEDVVEVDAPEPKSKPKRRGQASKKDTAAPKQKKVKLKQKTMEGGQVDAASDEDGEGGKKKNPAKRPVLDSKVSSPSHLAA